MKIQCLHGFYKMSEQNVGQASDFSRLYGLDLVARDGYITFDLLGGAPDHSLIGRDFLGFEAIKTFAGTPWDVFKANEVVYDFNEGVMKAISTVTGIVDVKPSGNRLVSKGLISAGSIDQEGRKISGYTAWYLRNTASWLYTEVTYV